MRGCIARASVSLFSNRTPSISPMQAAYILASERAFATPLPAGSSAARPAGVLKKSTASAMASKPARISIMIGSHTFTPAPSINERRSAPCWGMCGARRLCWACAWLRARERAGLTQVRVHDLKHTFGRRVRASGVSFEDRQDLLGHRSTRMTAHYSAPELSRLLKSANQVFERKGT